DPQECKQMADTGIDFLAAGIGNIHGAYPADWAGLSFDRLSEIADITGGELPLVLHGGSGIPLDQIQKAISLGVSKINVNTEAQEV
ncbi:class II fructose-bisphosphate aldolase, partial [Anaerostipes hadrus]